MFSPDPLWVKFTNYLDGAPFMSHLSQQDLDNLTNRLFLQEQNCRPGAALPDYKDMAQLLKEARLAIDQLSQRLEATTADKVKAESDLDVERKKSGVWK